MAESMQRVGTADSTELPSGTTGDEFEKLSAEQNSGGRNSTTKN
jgi:hypothetical protein